MKIEINVTVEDSEGQKQNLKFTLQTSDTETHAFCSDNKGVIKDAIEEFREYLLSEDEILIKK